MLIMNVFMEQLNLIKLGRISIVATLLLSMISCVGIRMGSEVDLGGDYFYVQDSPQCICQYPRRNVVLPIGELDEIVIRVQYNDSIIVATCSPGYHSSDTTVYTINKRTGDVLLLKEPISDTFKCDNEVRNRHWYSIH